ncbi:MAG: zinc ribbon domain-containing protein [Formosimonas sp.]
MLNKGQRLPEKAFQVVMWVLAVLFALFLLGLGNLLIRDLPQVQTVPPIEQFESAELKTLKAEIAARGKQDVQLGEQMDKVQLALEAAQNRYAEAKQGFDNWAKTRSSTENNAQNPEVVARTQKLDVLQVEVSRAQQQLEALQAQRLSLNQVDDSEKLAQLTEQADKARQVVENQHMLKVFVLRLLITLPALLLAAWLFVKQRKSRYWPFVWGFVFFALYAFFVELVPYLPSYGGYVRYIVGLLALLIGGHYGITRMQNYLAHKQAEELKLQQASQAERRQEFTYERALGHLARNVCPSCERALNTASDGNFCVHCGLCVYKPCASCNSRISAFFRFCGVCGHSQNQTTGESS